VDATGILPYVVLSHEEAASVFGSQTQVDETNVQGFRLANGDTIVLYAAPLVPSKEVFTQAYGGEGRKISARSYDRFGYLVASKNYAEKLGEMALVAAVAPTLEDAIASVKTW
jgi:hypothetical protein